MTDFEKFIHDNGCKYKTEEELRSGYDRAWKAQHGVLLTEEEFLTEAGKDTDEAKAAYNRLKALCDENKIKAAEVYRYAKLGWCLREPYAIVAYEGDKPFTYYVNNCDTGISDPDATLKINEEWGFEASRIRIVGKPYYDATDWQFIRFNCAGMAWLWVNGDLVKVCDD